WIGTITDPVVGSASWPAWMARVANPSLMCSSVRAPRAGAELGRADLRRGAGAAAPRPRIAGGAPGSLRAADHRAAVVIRGGVTTAAAAARAGNRPAAAAAARTAAGAAA